MIEAFDFIANKLKKLGKEYYDKGDKQATAIFWELETVFRNASKDETLNILSDNKLMVKIRDAREKGGPSSPYKPLTVVDNQEKK